MKIAQKAALAGIVLLAVMILGVGRGQTASAGRYASVHGLRMYYEVHGTGRPLVLLHGAFGTIETDFQKVLPAFRRHGGLSRLNSRGTGILPTSIVR